MREYFVWLAKLITLFIVVIIAIPTMIGAAIVAGKEVASKDEHRRPTDKKIAVIELVGVIENSKDIIEELYENADDKHIDGIVIRIDSPGGAVAPSQDLYQTILKLKEKKPIVASMGSLAASGGFYTAVAATKVLAQPGTMTGSIGVLMQIPNVTKITEMIGFDMITIRAGTMKDAGNSFRMMTPEERVYLENTTAMVHTQFINDVASARKMTSDKVKLIADGRVILGEEAKTLGLIDGFGDVYEAARLIYEIKGQPLRPDEMPELIYKDQPFKDFKKAFQSVINLPALFTKRAPEIRAQLY
jgi:protease-4